DVDQYHVADPERPPLPVPRHPLARDEPGHVKWRIDAERRRGHGRAGQPPREGAAGHEELRHRPRAPPREVDADGQGEDEVGADDDPIQRAHGRPPGGDSAARRGAGGPDSARGAAIRRPIRRRGLRPAMIQPGAVMETRTEGSMLEKVFFGLGYLLEELDGVASGKGSAVLAKGLEALDPDRDDRELPASLALAAAGWLAAKVPRPRRVRWHRAVAAGIAATVLEELTRRRTGQAGDDADGVGPVNRFAAGIGAAAAYAALFYPRLPGPPLARGLLFGTLRAALAPEGGPV